MGADGAFERRRLELAIIQKKDPKDISDDAVVQSYKDEADPAEGKDNFMLQYLERAQLAFRFGTVMFVHGAVTKDNLGAVPGEEERADAKEWERRLNAWARKEVEAFKAKPYAGTNT